MSVECLAFIRDKVGPKGVRVLGPKPAAQGRVDEAGVPSTETQLSTQQMPGKRLRPIGPLLFGGVRGGEKGYWPQHMTDLELIMNTVRPVEGQGLAQGHRASARTDSQNFLSCLSPGFHPSRTLPCVCNSSWKAFPLK